MNARTVFVQGFKIIRSHTPSYTVTPECLFIHAHWSMVNNLCQVKDPHGDCQTN